MSYAVRNTLILLATIIVLFAGGWAFIRYFYEDPIIQQKAEIEQKRADLAIYTDKTGQYVSVEEQLRTVRFQYENHTKQFFSNNNVAVMFDYLRTINTGAAQTSLNFTLIDSVLQDQYGVIRVKLSGGGTYDAFYNFMSILEQSKPMTKITDLRISAQTDNAGTDFILYEATLNFYFTRATSIENPALLINFETPRAIHNPFNPLVKFEPSRGSAPEPILTENNTNPPANTGPPPNSEGLPDINRSTLVGLVRSGVYLEDQQRQIVYIPIGGRVYLGTLDEISLSRKTATFRITRGNQTEFVTLQISEN
jgi:Tfp pilus assembly protein PilO